MEIDVHDYLDKYSKLETIIIDMKHSTRNYALDIIKKGAKQKIWILSIG